MTTGGTQSVLVLSDLHIPHHDPAAWALAMAVVRYVRPTRVILNGDMLDFYLLSAYDRDPDRYADGKLQEELDQWRRLARELRVMAGDGCLIEYLPGNHEDRLRRYLWRHSELHGLRALELPVLMGLDEFGIGYSEYEIEIVPGRLNARHGRVVRKNSAASARAELEHERFAVSVITGHTHRLGETYVRTRRGLVKALENGCLCNLEPEYVRHPDWQLGLTLVTHWGGELFDAANIPFLGQDDRLKAVVWGNVVTL